MGPLFGLIGFFGLIFCLVAWIWGLCAAYLGKMALTFLICFILGLMFTD